MCNFPEGPGVCDDEAGVRARGPTAAAAAAAARARRLVAPRLERALPWGFYCLFHFSSHVTNLSLDVLNL